MHISILNRHAITIKDLDEECAVCRSCFEVFWCDASGKGKRHETFACSAINIDLYQFVIRWCSIIWRASESAVEGVIDIAHCRRYFKTAAVATQCLRMGKHSRRDRACHSHFRIRKIAD